MDKLSAFAEIPMMPPKLDSEKQRSTVSFAVPGESIIHDKLNEIKDIVKVKIEQAIRDLAGDTALLAVNNGLIIASRYTVKSHIDYSTLWGGDHVKYYVEAFNFVVGEHNAWIPHNNWNSDNMFPNYTFRDSKVTFGRVPEVRHNKLLNIDEWKCEYCGTPNPIEERSCMKCGAPRALLVHEFVKRSR